MAKYYTISPRVECGGRFQGSIPSLRQVTEQNGPVPVSSRITAMGAEWRFKTVSGTGRLTRSFGSTHHPAKRSFAVLRMLALPADPVVPALTGAGSRESRRRGSIQYSASSTMRRQKSGVLAPSGFPGDHPSNQQGIKKRDIPSRTSISCRAENGRDGPTTGQEEACSLMATPSGAPPTVWSHASPTSAFSGGRGRENRSNPTTGKSRSATHYKYEPEEAMVPVPPIHPATSACRGTADPDRWRL